jgi:Domain of unknown function (DUF4281)
MNQDLIFKACTLLATAGWLGLIFLPRRPRVRTFTGIVIPAVIGVLYVGAFALSLRDAVAGGGFGSLDAVALLFQNRWALLAGWIHYLAFDLFVGTWIVRDATERRVLHPLLVPLLVLTFLLGPAGLLGYLLLRRALTRS